MYIETGKETRYHGWSVSPSSVHPSLFLLRPLCPVKETIGKEGG